MRSEELSYEGWLASLPGCITCGRVDPMDYIEGKDQCAACWLDENSDDEDEEWDDSGLF